MGKAAVKHSVIYNFFSGCIASSLTKTIGLFVGSFLFTRIVEDHTPQYLPVSYLSYLVPLGYAVYSLKLLVFELLLLIHIVQWSVGKWDWYTKVDENVFLGAIPMTSLGHVSELTKKLRIHAVLSINENYELNACTFAGCPVTYIQWKDLDVDQYAIPSKDFLPPSFAVLMEGADYINFHVQEGRNVYCHCKSGIGRSASTVLAYMIKHKKYSAMNAYTLLKRKRPTIFSENSPQLKNIIAFEDHVREGTSFKPQRF